MTTAPPEVFRLALRSAVRDGYFTPDQARGIAGRLQLPLDFLPGREVLNVHVSTETWRLVYLELFSLINGGWSNRPGMAWQEAMGRIAALRIEELLRIHEQAQTDFEHKNKHLAWLWITGAITLAAWRWNFWALVRKLHLYQAGLAAGQVLEGKELADLLERLAREADYVNRFAEAIFAGKVADLANEKTERPAPHTEDGIRSRGDLYGGSARGSFYEIRESLHPLDDGWVEHYIARDDDHTCSPCSAATGYYLPRTGPYPGLICEGRGKCRCVRLAEFRPEIFRELMLQSS